MILPTFYNGNSQDTYVKYVLGNRAHLMVTNDDGANLLNYSFDGVTTHGILYNEVLEMRDVNVDEIYIKSNSGGASCSFRVFSYGDRLLLYGNNPRATQDNIIPSDFNPYTFNKVFP